jgi:hypothetical protein
VFSLTFVGQFQELDSDNSGVLDKHDLNSAMDPADPQVDAQPPVQSVSVVAGNASYDNSAAPTPQADSQSVSGSTQGSLL